jgi:hypothetical protein
MKFPSVSEVARAVSNVNANVEGEADVHLQVYENGEWALRWGLPDYDQDHRGYWGSSSVPGVNRRGQVSRINAKAIAKDLLEQAKDQRTENPKAPTKTTKTVTTTNTWTRFSNPMGGTNEVIFTNPVAHYVISPKQWRGYFSMHNEPWGPSANDGYNISKYGISSEQYRSLLKIAESAAGMDGKRVTRAQIQKLLNGDEVFLSRADPRDIERVSRAFGGA